MFYFHIRLLNDHKINVTLYYKFLPKVLYAKKFEFFTNSRSINNIVAYVDKPGAIKTRFIKQNL